MMRLLDCKKLLGTNSKLKHSGNVIKHITSNNLNILESHIDIEVSFHDINKKVQVGKDQEKAQSEKDSHSKNRGGKKPN